jgi:hypothetical protein
MYATPSRKTWGTVKRAEVVSARKEDGSSFRQGRMLWTRKK